jgi:hypothetical protein
MCFTWLPKTGFLGGSRHSARKDSIGSPFGRLGIFCTRLRTGLVQCCVGRKSGCAPVGVPNQRNRRRLETPDSPCVIRSGLTCLRQVAKAMNSIHGQLAPSHPTESATLPFVIPSEAEESAVSPSRYQMPTGKPFCSSGAKPKGSAAFLMCGECEGNK